MTGSVPIFMMGNRQQWLLPLLYTGGIMTRERCYPPPLHKERVVFVITCAQTDESPARQRQTFQEKLKNSHGKNN